jgi:hypothetical protein
MAARQVPRTDELRGFRLCSLRFGALIRSWRSKGLTMTLLGERMKHFSSPLVMLAACLIVVPSLFAQQAPASGLPADYSRPQQNSAAAYTPKFKGDPARSDSEAAALAYVRVVMRAEKGFNKQYGHYALTLNELVHSGSFTKRMVNPQRGDYTVTYKGKKESYVLTMMPKMLDATHRSFYVDDDGKIRGDEAKLAGPDSPIVK